jgi:gas vesicle protein
MPYCKTENTMALLGGAVLGAAAMYLLDPESGRRRREHLAEATGDALGRAGGAIGPAWDRISEGARDIGSRLSEGAVSIGSAASDRFNDWRSAAAERASDVRDGGGDMLSGWGNALGSIGRRFSRRARGYGEDAADSARHYRDRAWGSARDYARRAASGARGMLPWGQEESHAGAYTAAGLTAAALGAGAIYFFDRTNGRRRRQLALDQVNRIVNDTGRCMRRTGQYVQDVMNRSRGVVHEARSRFGGQDVSPETLMQRIRSQMGHVVSNAGAVSVMVNGNGDVTLTGRVLGSELETLLSTIQRVAGVGRIINRLDVQDTPEAVAGGDAGTTAGQRL